MWAASPGRALRTKCSHRAHRSLDRTAATGDYRRLRGAAGVASGGTPRSTHEGSFDGGHPQPRSRRRRRPALALAPRASRGRGRGPARRWPGGLRRQRLVVVPEQRRQLDARRNPEEGRELPPRCHGRRRERHHRRPEHRHQARPDPPDRQLGDAHDLQRGLRPRDGRAGGGGRLLGGRPGRRASPVGHRVPQRQDPDRRRRHLLDQAHPEPEGRALRRCRARLGRSEQAHEDGRQHGADRAEAARLHHPRPARPVLQRHRARRLRAQGRPEVDRDGAVQDPELHAGPAERGRPERELLAAGLRRAVVRPGDGHRLRRLRGAGERPAVGPAGCHHRHPVRPDRHRQGAGDRDPRGYGRRLAAALHGDRPRPVHRRQGAPGLPPHGRPSGALGAGARRATAGLRTTSTRRSTPATRPTWRSASRTSSRPSLCSSPPARTV